MRRPRRRARGTRRCARGCPADRLGDVAGPRDVRSTSTSPRGAFRVACGGSTARARPGSTIAATRRRTARWRRVRPADRRRRRGAGRRDARRTRPGGWRATSPGMDRPPWPAGREPCGSLITPREPTCRGSCPPELSTSPVCRSCCWRRTTRARPGVRASLEIFAAHSRPPSATISVDATPVTAPARPPHSELLGIEFWPEADGIVVAAPLGLVITVAGDRAHTHLPDLAALYSLERYVYLPLTWLLHTTTASSSTAPRSCATACALAPRGQRSREVDARGLPLERVGRRSPTTS